MFLDTMIEIGIWATARPRHEVSLANDELTSRIANIADTEREQGMCDYLYAYSIAPPSASCPYSPPPPSFVCSRSMGTPSFDLYYLFLLLINSYVFDSRFT
jgi:hypothetical protein